MASINPPGVFSRTISSAAFSCRACAMAPATISAVIGCTIPSTSAITTTGAAANACAASPADIARMMAARNLLSLYLLRFLAARTQAMSDR